MSESFEKMSVIELRQKAKELGVKLGAGINKQGIIDKLKEAAVGASAPEAPAEETPAEATPQAQEPAPRPIRSAAIITATAARRENENRSCFLSIFMFTASNQSLLGACSA